MILISIDPGVRFLGWAIWQGRALVNAGCSKSRAAVSMLDHARVHVNNIPPTIGARVVIESMTVRGAQASTPPQDLIDVQTVGMLVASGLGTVEALLRASDWKSTIPKSIHHPRIREALEEHERGIVGAACERAGANAKEVLDAVGIGAYYLGRINQAGEKRA